MMGEKTASSTKAIGKVVSSLQETKTRSMFITCTSINSKWIKDLNIRCQTLKLVQERVGNTLEVIGISKDYLNRTPAAQQLRESIDKWDFIKLKSFCSTKETEETTHRVEENICQLHIRQRNDNQNIQGTQKTKLSQN
jgi:hypothetical protein